jgi:hypothetical protein
MTTTTGAIRRNGTDAPSDFLQERGCRRLERGEVVSAATAVASGTRLLKGDPRPA